VSWTPPDAPDAISKRRRTFPQCVRQSLMYTHTKHTSIMSDAPLRGELLTKDWESLLLISKSKLMTRRRCEHQLTVLRRQKISHTNSRFVRGCPIGQVSITGCHYHL